jgi:hypothetical protein
MFFTWKSFSFPEYSGNEIGWKLDWFKLDKKVLHKFCSYHLFLQSKLQMYCYQSNENITWKYICRFLCECSRKCRYLSWTKIYINPQINEIIKRSGRIENLTDIFIWFSWIPSWFQQPSISTRNMRHSEWKEDHCERKGRSLPCTKEDNWTSLFWYDS